MTMILILSAIILILIIVIIRLNIQFYNEKNSFKSKLFVFQNIILAIAKKQLNQQEQIKLSQDLEASLKTSNAKLNNDIFRLNYDLFEIVTKNKMT